MILQYLRYTCLFILFWGNTFHVGDHIPWHNALDGKKESVLRHLLVTQDPQFDTVKSSFGHLTFLQVAQLCLNVFLQTSYMLYNTCGSYILCTLYFHIIRLTYKRVGDLADMVSLSRKAFTVIEMHNNTASQFFLNTCINIRFIRH